MTDMQVNRWLLFTDGVGPIPQMAPHAGWGVAVSEESSTSPSPQVELFGPVCIHTADARWVGAESETNNTGELTAMIEALLWLESEAPGPPEVHATILYDSTYAHASVTSQSNPTTNEKLVAKSRAIFERVSRIRPFDFVYVRGHSGNLGNNHADRLAGLGTTGQQTTQSARWLLPLAAPPPVHPLQVDHCCRCGRVFSGPSYARRLAVHEAYCKAANSFRGKHRGEAANGRTMFGRLATFTKKSVGVPLCLLAFAHFAWSCSPKAYLMNGSCNTKKNAHNGRQMLRL